MASFGRGSKGPGREQRFVTKDTEAGLTSVPPTSTIFAEYLGTNLSHLLKEESAGSGIDIEKLSIIDERNIEPELIHRVTKWIDGLPLLSEEEKLVERQEAKPGKSIAIPPSTQRSAEQGSQNIFARNPIFWNPPHKTKPGNSNNHSPIPSSNTLAKSVAPKSGDVSNGRIKKLRTVEERNCLRKKAFAFAEKSYKELPTKKKLLHCPYTSKHTFERMDDLVAHLAECCKRYREYRLTREKSVDIKCCQYFPNLHHIHKDELEAHEEVCKYVFLYGEPAPLEITGLYENKYTQK